MNIFQRLSSIVSLFALVFISVQCGPKVTANKLNDVDLSKYKTYAFLPNPDTIRYRNIDGSLVEEKVMDEINQDMQARGYTIDKDNPDLLIKTNAMFEQEEELVSDPVAYTNYGYYTPGFTPGYTSPYYYSGYNTVGNVTGGYGVEEVQYTEGTIVIDLIDAETDEIVWRGWAEEAIEPENFVTEVREYVDEVFDEYPVENASSM